MKVLKVLIGLLLVVILLTSISCGAAVVEEEVREEEGRGEKVVIVESAGTSRVSPPAPEVIVFEDEEMAARYEPEISTNINQSMGHVKKFA